MDDYSTEKTIISSGPRQRWPLLVGGVLAIIIAAAVLIWFFAGRADAPKDANLKAADEFYSMLGNAAQQQRLKVSMYRTTYATKADADVGKNPGSELSSVSELDTETKEYRSVFAHNLFDKPKFDIGRCVGKEVYNDNYKSSTERPTTLAAGSEALKTRVYKMTQPLRFISCPYLGVIPQSAPDLAVTRLSDGVFPVTLSSEQAEQWKQRIKDAGLFEVKDEGVLEHEGAQLRKFSFEPRRDDANRQLFDIFYETAEIEEIKQENPGGSWEYAFISVNPNNSGSVGGFYLVDESKNLPVYSELHGVNPDKDPADSGAAGRNIARTKQHYEYTSRLTITPQTSLEFLE